jgi:hypothetical protein
MKRKMGAMSRNITSNIKNTRNITASKKEVNIRYRGKRERNNREAIIDNHLYQD